MASRGLWHRSQPLPVLRQTPAGSCPLGPDRLLLPLQLCFQSLAFASCQFSVTTLSSSYEVSHLRKLFTFPFSNYIFLLVWVSFPNELVRQWKWVTLDIICLTWVCFLVSPVDWTFFFNCLCYSCPLSYVFKIFLFKLIHSRIKGNSTLYSV